MRRHAPPPTKFGRVGLQAMPASVRRGGPAPPPTRYGAALRQAGGAVSLLPSGPAGRPAAAMPPLASRTVMPFARRGAIQRASMSKRDALSGVFRNYAYPIGSASGLLSADEESKEGEGKK
jgi:hypothetical protein